MTDEKIVQPRNGRFQHFQISDNEIEKRLQAVVSITTTIPEHAETAEILGTNRSGNGVFINQMGLIVTVGYLIAEAEQIWVSTANGETVLADTIVYDYESGLALLKPLKKYPYLPLAYQIVVRKLVREIVSLCWQGSVV